MNIKRSSLSSELHPKNWTQFLEVQFFMSKHSKEVKEKAIYLSEKDGVALDLLKSLRYQKVL